MLRTALCERHIHSIASSRLCTAAAALSPSSSRKCSEQSVHWKKCSMKPLPQHHPALGVLNCPVQDRRSESATTEEQGCHRKEAMKKAPPEASGLTCAARLCSSSHKPHVYPRVPSLLPLQPPYSCNGPLC